MDFYINTPRLGAVPLSKFANVFHVYSGRLDFGAQGFVPRFGWRELHIANPGTYPQGVYYGNNYMFKYPVAEKGIPSSKVWHSASVVTSSLDFEADMADLISVPGTGSVYSPDDGMLYTSPSDCLKRSHQPVVVTVGQLYG